MVKTGTNLILATLAALCLSLGGITTRAHADNTQKRTFPPADEAVVTLENFMVPPYNRWSFQHIRELLPTRAVYRGDGPARALDKAPLPLDELKFELYGGQTIDLPTWLEESKTDSFLVLHKGRIVYDGPSAA